MRDEKGLGAKAALSKTNTENIQAGIHSVLMKTRSLLGKGRQKTAICRLGDNNSACIDRHLNLQG